MKTVYQLNAEGFFVGTTTAEQSPLEPGAFLVPGGCVEETPPEIPSGKQARWNNGWILEDIPAAPTEPEPIPPTIEEIRSMTAVTMRQCRLYLHSIGQLATVTSVINNLPEPDKTAAQIEWEYATVIQRNSPLIATLAPYLGWETEEEIDAAFTAAALL